MRPRSVRMAWALLFSAPVGVGVGLAVARVTGDGLLSTDVLGSALLFAVPLFVLVFAALTVNQDEDPMA